MLIYKLVAFCVICVFLYASTSQYGLLADEFNDFGIANENTGNNNIDSNTLSNNNADDKYEETTYDGDYETDSNRETEGGETYGDNGEDVAAEPFDPEKNGLLIHEYYDKVYEKYPDYDTGMMKQNLNYLGDVLSTEPSAGVKEIDTVSDQFELEPDEREMIMKKAEPPKDEFEGAEDNENEEKTPDSDYSPVAPQPNTEEEVEENQNANDDYEQLWK